MQVTPNRDLRILISDWLEQRGLTYEQAVARQESGGGTEALPTTPPGPVPRRASVALSGAGSAALSGAGPSTATPLTQEPSCQLLGPLQEISLSVEAVQLSDQKPEASSALRTEDGGKMLVEPLSQEATVNQPTRETMLQWACARRRCSNAAAVRLSALSHTYAFFTSCSRAAAGARRCTWLPLRAT